MHLVRDIDIQHGLLGGVVLGVSASAFMLLTGKITGLSGIAEGVVSIKGENWNYSYIAGLGTAGALLAIFKPETFGPESGLPSGKLLVAGLLTGFGTRLAGGCTSGHGLCGLPRRSPRSLASVLTFMTTGALTAHFSRSSSAGGLFTASADEIWGPIIPAVVAAVGGLYATMNLPGVYKKIVGFFSSAPSKSSATEISSTSLHAAAFGSSLLFGLGLGISGMCNPARVLRFLDFAGAEGWDPTLASVLGGGVVVTFLTFHYFKRSNTPIALDAKKSSIGAGLSMGTAPSNMVIDWKLLLGSALFGVGWGLTGMCPGPAIVVAGGGGAAAWKFVPSMLAGMVAKEILLG
jgi:uncharacterized membrane protein YedE/YeeE